MQWSVEISQWHRVGPGLMALIVCLALRMRLSRARIREWLGIGLGVTLATGTLNQGMHEAAQAVLSVEEQPIDEVNRSTALRSCTAMRPRGRRPERVCGGGCLPPRR